MFMFNELGVKNVRYMRGRVLSMKAGGGQLEGMDKVMIGGSAFEVLPTPANGTNYIMDECDIIIIPKKRFTNLIGADGYRIDQAMSGGLGSDDVWESVEQMT